MVKNMIIGVTGRMGSGKSLVSKLIAAYTGYEYISCDELVAKLYENEHVKNKLDVAFQTHDREDIKNLLLPSGYKTISAIFQPFIVGYLLGYMNANQSYVIEIPLLFEGDYDYMCDKIINVESDVKIRVERLEKRDITNWDSVRYMESIHYTDEVKNARATFVFLNNGCAGELENYVYDFVEKEL